jgi:tRNA nucleotidyltransferase (CCA-adding enzyme)
VNEKANIAGAVERLLPADILALARVTAEIARANKTQAVLVGGVVRDLMLGRLVIDADFMIEPPVAPVAHALAHQRHGKLTEHDRFQTFNIKFPDGRKIDIVTAREETYPSPGALPKVKASTIEKDLRRRDFTINAMVCRLDEKTFGDVIDPFDGRGDLARRQIRALHAKSFEDDPTRIFRAARFAGRLGFKVEPDTRSWIDAAIRSGVPKGLSAVRRRHEFELILKEDKPTAALMLLREWDALRLIHPDWGAADVASIGLDKVFAPDEETSLLEGRLIHWLRWWGPSRAQKMMDDLSFERAIKRTVTRKLIV